MAKICCSICKLAMEVEKDPILIAEISNSDKLKQAMQEYTATVANCNLFSTENTEEMQIYFNDSLELMSLFVLIKVGKIAYVASQLHMFDSDQQCRIINAIQQLHEKLISQFLFTDII